MRSILLVVTLVLAGAGCSVDSDTGPRFRAERELHQANWQYQKLSVRPQLATEAMWRDLAAKFEAVANRRPVTPNSEGTQREIQVISARALFTAAQIYGTIQDTTQAEQIFLRMQRDFSDIAEVSAPVSMAQGAVSERRGRFAEAADHYQAVVDEIAPVATDPGVSGGVLELPLRIARLRSQDAAPADRDAHYSTARAYYDGVVTDHPDTPLQLRAMSLLADLAGDRGDWDEAARQLTASETLLRNSSDPIRDPAEVRLQLAQVAQKSGAGVPEVEAILQSLVEDYPDSQVIPLTLLTLARAAIERGDTDTALERLEIIRSDHGSNETIATEALMTRARLLETDDRRWSEALKTYREVALIYPISESALNAPLEIVRHYERVNDEAAKQDALERATRDYRDFIDRYPPGSHTLLARERLAQSLAQQEEFGEAVAQMERIGESAAGSRRGAAALVAAAGIAYRDLADTTRALALLDRVSETYAQVDIGAWAEREASRLRESGAP